MSKTGPPDKPVRNAAPIDMTLCLEAGRSSRRVIQMFSVFMPAFADTFQIRRTPVKGGGIRLSLDTDHVIVGISAVPGTSRVVVSASSEGNSVAPGLYGRVGALLGAFVSYVRQADDQVQVVPVESHIADLSLVQEWGRWAYERVIQQVPFIVKQPATPRT